MNGPKVRTYAGSELHDNRSDVQADPSTPPDPPKRADSSRLDSFLSEKELQRHIPYSPMHIWRLEKAGLFPRRIRIGANRVGWSLEEVNAWIEAKKAHRA